MEFYRISDFIKELHSVSIHTTGKCTPQTVSLLLKAIIPSEVQKGTDGVFSSFSPTDGSPPIAIRASPIHGLGLFATKPIGYNYVVGIYSADIHISTDNQELPTIKFATQAIARMDTADLSNIISDYSVDSDSATTVGANEQDHTKRNRIVAIPYTREGTDLTDPVNLILSAHCINDACPFAVRIFQNIKPGEIKKLAVAIRLYYDYCLEHANCHLSRHDTFVAAVTTKPVEAGTELLAFYDAEYFLSKHTSMKSDESHSMIARTYEEELGGVEAVISKYNALFRLDL